jgi:hypothetical protein
MERVREQGITYVGTPPSPTFTAPSDGYYETRMYHGFENGSAIRLGDEHQERMQEQEQAARQRAITHAEEADRVLTEHHAHIQAHIQSQEREEDRAARWWRESTMIPLSQDIPL